jgi:hypothetical protein
VNVSDSHDLHKLTLIVIVLYMDFTRKMQQTMVKETKADILPAFIVISGIQQKPGGGGHA